MATVNRMVGAQKLEKFIARQVEVQGALTREAETIRAKADANLTSAADHRTPLAHLGVERGRIDRYVYLEDPPDGSSPGAAMSIEYGHYAGKRGKPDREWVEGLFPLHDAINKAHPERHGP